MYMRNLMEIVNSKGYIDVEFGRDVEECDGPTNGMRARIESVTLDQSNGYDCWILKANMSVFESYNDSLDTRDFYDSQGKPCLSWKESGYYPKDGIENLYVNEEFDCRLIDDKTSNLYNRYLMEGNGLSYLSWLESLVS